MREAVEVWTRRGFPFSFFRCTFTCSFMLSRSRVVLLYLVYLLSWTRHLSSPLFRSLSLLCDHLVVLRRLFFIVLLFRLVSHLLLFYERHDLMHYFHPPLDINRARSTFYAVGTQSKTERAPSASSASELNRFQPASFFCFLPHTPTPSSYRFQRFFQYADPHRLHFPPQRPRRQPHRVRRERARFSLLLRPPNLHRAIRSRRVHPQAQRAG